MSAAGRRSQARPAFLMPLGDATPAVDTLAMLYCRVSKEEQAESGKVSLDTQNEDGRGYVQRRPGARLLKVFSDIESGRRDDRDGYQQMLSQVRAEVAAGRRVIVVVAALARLGRRMAERVNSWEELKRLGVSVHSVREGGEVTEVFYNIMASLAQEESRLLSERVTRSNRSYREHGWVKPGGCRWGYRWRPANKAELANGSPSIVLEEDPETGPYVREFFERAEAGASAGALARWTATLPAAARGIGHNGAPRVLNYAGVRQILHAPVYIARHGTFVRSIDELLARPAGHWPALVSDEQWQRIHGMSWRQRPTGGDPRRYALTGMLWCGRCRTYRMGGRTLKPRPRKNRPGLTPLRTDYTCTGAQNGASCQFVVPTIKVEQLLTEQLHAIYSALSVPGTTERARALAVAEDKREARSRTGTRLGALRTELTRAETLLTESWIQSTDGRLTPTAFATIQARLTPEIERLKSELQALGRAMPDPDVRLDTAVLEMVLAGAPAWADALALAAKDPDGRQAIRDAAGVLIQRVWPVRTGYGQYRLDVLYTDAGLKVLRFLAANDERRYVDVYHMATALYQEYTYREAGIAV